MKIKKRINELRIPDILCPFGKKIETKEEFERAKDDIRLLLQKEEYGMMPNAPTSWQVEILQSKGLFGKKVIRTDYRFIAQTENGEICFNFYSLLPEAMPKRLPVFISLNFSDLTPNASQPSEEIIDRGYGIFGFHHDGVAKDSDDFEYGCGPLCKDRSDPYATGKIAIWAWVAMRIIDYVETLDFFDPEALIVTGHSRLGKASLLTAAFDERVKFVCANDSGTSGDALARGTVGESIEAIARVFPFWFCPNYMKYKNNEDSLPFDQHFLLSLIAPRHILIGSAELDKWADPKSEFLSLTLTDEVYKLYGESGLIHGEEIPEGPIKLQEGSCSFHTRRYGHAYSREDWNNYMDFIDKALGR